MTLELIKIEDGIAAGEVLYHSIVNRTPQEVEQLKQRREKKSKLKESRKLQQMANVKRKEEIKEEHKQRSLAGMKRKQQEIDGEDVVESPETAGLEPEGDNDVEYYKDAVGRMPDKDAYIPKGTKRGKPLYDGTGKKQKRDGSSKGRNDKKDGKDFKNKGKDSENNTGKKHSKVKWSEMTLDQRKKAKKKVKERQHIKKYGRKRR